MADKLRLALFGGTFNPIHNGHIHLALEWHQQIGFDKILLIPTNLPPHKEAHDLASNEDRLAMCRLVAKRHPIFEVSDLECRTGGVSYTVDTVEAMHRLYPDAVLYWLVGSDMLLTFDQWYRYRDILRGATLLAGARTAGEYESLSCKADQLCRDGGEILVRDIPPIDLSSTEIRRRVKYGEEISGLTDPAVAEYIRENGLYRS